MRAAHRPAQLRVPVRLPSAEGDRETDGLDFADGKPFALQGKSTKGGKQPATNLPLLGQFADSRAPWAAKPLRSICFCRALCLARQKETRAPSHSVEIWVSSPRETAGHLVFAFQRTDEMACTVGLGRSGVVFRPSWRGSHPTIVMNEHPHSAAALESARQRTAAAASARILMSREWTGESPTIPTGAVVG